MTGKQTKAKAPKAAAGPDTPATVREQGYISIKDLCAELAITKPTLYATLERFKGRIAETKIGRRRYFNKAEVFRALFPEAAPEAPKEGAK